MTAYIPPRPHALSALFGLVRTAFGGEGNLLSLLPAAAYRVPAGHLGWSRRGILIVNAPELTRGILTDSADQYPKNDLMVGALEPLVGESIFVTSGDAWRRQRRMTNPAFSHIRLNRAFTSMAAAVDDYEARLLGLAASHAPFSLDMAMSHLTADIICRTVFSTSLQSEISRDVFDAFAVFERSVAHVELKRLIFDPPGRAIPQHASVLAACETIRRHLGTLVDSHLGTGAAGFNDIATALVAARDETSGESFSRKELIDQLGVFFLAGHETSASALTWAFFLARIRTEIAAVVGDGPLQFEHIRQLPLVRNVFQETLRLYPPIPFLPRIAAEATRIGRFRVKKGTMIMISPWTIQRHQAYWPEPHRFDPDRFTPEREATIATGTYMPFGIGPRVCMGASFASTEAVLILARLLRRFDFLPESPRTVRPVARLTIRPAEQIQCRVSAVAQR
jgi:cytochrome P450